MISINVDLGANSYPIFVSENTLEHFRAELDQLGLSVDAIITDDIVFEKYGTVLLECLGLGSDRVVSIAPGEESKSFDWMEEIVSKLLELNLDRQSTMVAFGGGVVGDITGFVAAIFKRGIKYVHIPTTLLAQVDSSIGGKTGINHKLGKNQVGAIYQPKMVWSDVTFLQTLPRREILCGLGEIIKYGVIADAEFFEYVNTHLDDIIQLKTDVILRIVAHCAQIKANIVSQDERESGLRLHLNFGHTIGHAIEAALEYNKISHGEAILMGMVVESQIAVELNMLSEKEHRRLLDCISRISLPHDLSQISFSDLIEFITRDKKNIDDQIRMVLPKKIGEVRICTNIEPHLIERAFEIILSHST